MNKRALTVIVFLILLAGCEKRTKVPTCRERFNQQVHRSTFDEINRHDFAVRRRCLHPDMGLQIRCETQHRNDLDLASLRQHFEKRHFDEYLACEYGQGTVDGWRGK